jgi:uncharacterized protein YcbX
MGANGNRATVRELWRYPVKSMQGAPVERVDVGPRGIVGDRAWAVIDVTSGRALSAKTVPQLLDAFAVAVDGDVHVELPDGTRVVAGTAEASAAIGTWLERDVELRPSPATEVVSYEMTFDPPNDAAERFDIPSPEGTYFDLAGLHLLTTNSLAACARARPEGEWDRRRFRPNVLVAVGDDGDDGDDFPEDGWVGRTVDLGAVAADVMMRTVRCAMPLRAQPARDGDGALARDVGLYDTMNALHENHLGVYASVHRPGVIAVGDAVAAR